MNSKQYIDAALRTESHIDEVRVDDLTKLDAIIKAFVASAELLDLYKKNIFYGKPFNGDKYAAAVNQLISSGRWLNQPTSLTQAGFHPVNIDPRVFHAVVGIATEAGELVEAVNQQLLHQQKIDEVNLLEEIGDLNWYEAILISALGGDWDEIREKNIAKLRARYPEKFDADRAINRDVAVERKILEGDDFGGDEC